MNKPADVTGLRN